MYASLAAVAVTTASLPWPLHTAAMASYQKTPDHSLARNFCGLCSAGKVRLELLGSVLSPALLFLPSWHHQAACPQVILAAEMSSTFILCSLP